MKSKFFLGLLALSFIVTSCINGSSQDGVALGNSSEKTSVERGESVVIGANPAETNVQSEGFGRCLESGCYCKAFKGRGQTCQNCGHAYRRHY